MERVKNILFVQIHDIWFDTVKYLECKYNICALHTNDILDQDKYDFRLTTKTFLLDIRETEEDIFSKFEYKSARYAINKAIRDGVKVYKIVTPEERSKYMEFQRLFCEEKGIPMLREEELDFLSCYYALSKDGEYLGACAFLESADQRLARYKYGATLHKLNANEIILWRAIQIYHKLGYQYFDFGGCIPTDEKESYYYRHFHFKKKFGGELIDSYTYFRIKGLYRGFYWLFMGAAKLLFRGDINALTNFLYEKNILG